MEKDIKKSAKLTLLVGILMLIVITASTTYAYFKTRIKSPGSKISVMGSNFSLNITDNALTASGLKPIYDKNKSTQAVKKEFTISIGSAGVTSACYDLYIDVTSLGENLRNKYFKYELTNGTDTYTGSFNGRTDGSQILIIRNQNINNTNTSNSYTLYLWLSYSETEDQTDILSGDSTSRTFKGRILAKAVTGTCKESDTDPTTYMANLLVINGSADAVKKEVLKNGTVVFTITPKEGYTLEDATINCENGVLEGNKLTITNMQSDTTCVIQLGEDGPYATGTLASQILKDNPVIKVRTDFSVANTDDTTGTIYVQSSTSTSQMTEDTDGDGIGEDTYYYSGNTTNNWIKFGGYYVYRGTNSAGTQTRDFDTMEKCTSNSIYGNNCTAIFKSYYWRIVRINEDGSVRLAYHGESTEETKLIIDSVANHWWNNEGHDDSSYLDTNYASRAKTVIDYWYMDKFVDKNNGTSYNFDDYVSLTALYCSEQAYYKRNETTNGYYYSSIAQLRATANTPSYLCGGDGLGGIATTVSGTAKKLSASTASGGTGTLYCTSTEYYEPSKSWYGFRKLDTTTKCPIAMLTLDEYMYAGYKYGSRYNSDDYKIHLFVNSNNAKISGVSYIYTFTPWTDEQTLYITYSGYSDNNSDGGIRPSLSLKACVKYSSGDGTSTNPYTVTIDGTCASAEN